LQPTMQGYAPHPVRAGRSMEDEIEEAQRGRGAQWDAVRRAPQQVQQEAGGLPAPEARRTTGQRPALVRELQPVVIVGAVEATQNSQRELEAQP
jgi:hypothetical protein